MGEPPAKRARRVDSSTMWDSKDTRSRAPEQESDRDRRRSPAPRDDRRDARYRSRSRERIDGRRERSWSRDRRDRDRRDGDKDGRGAGDRKRSTSRERIQDRRGNSLKSVKFRERSRSRSPHRNGTTTRSPPRGPRGDRRDARSRDDGRKQSGTKSAPDRHEDAMEVDFNEDADEDEMEAQMRKALGFTRFRTTKDTKIPGNEIYAVRKEKKIEYRQYMNRQGGFNRPLSPSR